jgi:SAM-dependent methyltransferase
MSAEASDECRILNELRQTPQIFDAIATWTGSELALQSQLRKDYSDALVRAALSLAELRKKGRAKFTRADRMWLDRRRLEQATAESVARHKAKRFRETAWDLCCGIGGDAIALAEYCQVVAVDIDPAACLRTTWNAEVYDVASRVETQCRDLHSVVPTGGLLHIDPDRRAGSEGKVSRIEDYQPGLSELQELITRSRGGAIKVGPASNFGGKFADAEIEIISLSGECKEATVWFGELAGSQPFRATVLPAGATVAGHPLDAAAAVRPLGRYIYDPDPAVVRAGLIDVVAESLGLDRLDSAEEYLTGNERIDSPFVRAFEVLAELPNNESPLRSWLRTSDFGQVEIKCRHIPVKAEVLRRRLPLPGDQPGVVFVARLDGKSAMICARRCLQ